MDKATGLESTSGIRQRRKISSSLISGNNQTEREKNNLNKGLEHLRVYPSKIYEDSLPSNKVQCETNSPGEHIETKYNKKKALTASRVLLGQNKDLYLNELKDEEQPIKERRGKHEIKDKNYQRNCITRC